MTNTVLKPVWAGYELRLDPSNFPQRVSYAARDELDEISVQLDDRGAVMKKVLAKSGLPLSIALPARAFKGVAARAIDHGDGTVTVTLELHHSDPAMCCAAARRARSRRHCCGLAKLGIGVWPADADGRS
jgi:hypothetical protein